MRPVEPRAGQQPDRPPIQPGMHPVAVVFEFVQPLRPVGRRLVDQLGALRFYPLTCCMIFVHRSTIGSTLSAFSGGNIGTTRVTPISLRRSARSRSSPSANDECGRHKYSSDEVHVSVPPALALPR